MSELLLYRGAQAIELSKVGVALEPVSRWPWTGVMWSMLRQDIVSG